MRQTTMEKLERFLANRRTAKKVFPMDMNMGYVAAASAFLNKNVTLDEEKLRAAKASVKKKFGIFSNFRGTTMIPVSAILSEEKNPEELLRKMEIAYKVMKNEFHSNAYLPISALLMAQNVAENDFEKVTQRSCEIWQKMKKEHPILTSSEDYSYCVLFALTERKDEALIEEAEMNYDILKQTFSSSNNVQTMAHIVTLFEGEPETKCERVITFYQRMAEQGVKFGKTTELPTLALLALNSQDDETLIGEMTEIATRLEREKGFKALDGFNKKLRLMFAGLLAGEVGNETVVSVTGIQAMIAQMIAEEVAICAAIAASSAAAASSAN